MLHENNSRDGTEEPTVSCDPAGSNLRLNCELDPCPNQMFWLQWEFQACGPDSPNKCHSSQNSKWMVIQKNKLCQCKSRYTIINSTNNNSGLYRCVKYSRKFEEFKVLVTYEKRIVDRIDFEHGKNPIILDVLPMNATFRESAKIVIQCKVYSEFVLPPNIWWFKQIEEPPSPYNKGYQLFDNHKTYILINGSQRDFGNHTYMSKLIIDRANEKDSGIYSCVTINYFGMSEQDFSIGVIADEKQIETNSLGVLIFIFICIAMVPVSIIGLYGYVYWKNRIRLFLRATTMENNAGTELSVFSISGAAESAEPTARLETAV